MNLFKLVATVGLDTQEYERKTGDVVRSGRSMAGSLGSAVAKVGKVVAAGAVAAGSAITAITTQATKNFADYEQLVGGVETLFKDSSSQVLGYAKRAYKTAGLSANDYMETVTGFSASLLQSLGGDTKKAAEVADRAITDMSDNANKMGTSMESIQFAYQGFAKQNYTMLDNLKLGYGGTKAEMERLIEDANRLRKEQGLNADLTIDSYADVVEAIHTVQTEMGVTGTTAKEAATTISGSLASAKAAWHNLATGLADDNADMDKLVSEFVDSVKTAAHNLLPVAETAVHGAVQLFADLAPLMIAELPGMLRELTPELLDAALSLLQAVAEALPELVEVVTDVAPELVTMFATALVDATPHLLEAAQGLLDGLAEMVKDKDTLETLLDSAFEIVTALGGFIIDNIPLLVDIAIDLLEGLANYLTDPDNLEKIAYAGADLITRLAESLTESRDKIAEAVDRITSNIRAAFSTPEAKAKMQEAGKVLGDALLAALPTLADITRDILHYTSWGVLPQFPDWQVNEDGKTYNAKVQNPDGTLKIPEWEESIIQGITGTKPDSPDPPKRQNHGESSGHHSGKSPITGRVDSFNARGLPYVPWDGYVASLHRGEQVLTRAEAERKDSQPRQVVFSGLTINVSGAQYTNEDAMAQAIAAKLYDMTQGRADSYGY